MSNISKSKTQKVKRLYSMFGQSMKKSLDIVIELGCELYSIKEELPHGEFGKYINDNHEFDHDSACNYMNAYMANEKGLIKDGCTLTEAYGLIRGQKNKSSNDKDLALQIPNRSEFEEDEKDENGYNELKSGVDYDEEDEQESGEIIAGGSVIQVDRFKQEIPDEIVPVLIQVAKEYNELRKQANDIASTLKEFVGKPGHDRLEQKDIGPAFKNIKSLIKFAKPYCVCPMCSGDGGTGSVCGQCKGRGWLVEGEYRTLPQEIKDSLE